MQRELPCSGAEALYCSVPEALMRHSPQRTQLPHRLGPCGGSRVPAPASRSELSAGNTDQSSASLSLAAPRRMQMPIFTPTSALSDEGPSPSVSFLKERIHVSVTAGASKSWSGMSLSPVLPVCLVFHTGLPAVHAYRILETFVGNRAHGEEAYRTGVVNL